MQTKGDDIMLEIMSSDTDKGPSILVIGIGGGGNNAVDRMIAANLKGVSFAAINTDVAVLNNSSAEVRLQIGTKLLKGYGAGADPSLGEAAALENEEDIKKLVENKDMVIITCGMGGGTGTGAAPVTARICKELEILTMAVVTTPFSFENKPRMVAAESGISKLKENVDTLLIIPNDRLIEITDKQLKLNDAFIMADSVLKYTIEGISNIVYNRGVINIDFNDVKTTLIGKGVGHLGIGTVDEDGSILDAVKQAVNSPLLDTCIEGAENLLVNTSGNVNLIALNEAISYVRELAGPDVNLIWGTVSGDIFEKDKIVVTIIATGMPESKKKSLTESQAWFKISEKNKISSQCILDSSTFSRPEKYDLAKVDGASLVKPLHAVEEKQISIPTFLTDCFPKTFSMKAKK